MTFSITVNPQFDFYENDRQKCLLKNTSVFWGDRSVMFMTPKNRSVIGHPLFRQECLFPIFKRFADFFCKSENSLLFSILFEVFSGFSRLSKTWTLVIFDLPTTPFHFFENIKTRACALVGVGLRRTPKGGCKVTSNI